LFIYVGVLLGYFLLGFGLSYCGGGWLDPFTDSSEPIRREQPRSIPFSKDKKNSNPIMFLLPEFLLSTILQRRHSILPPAGAAIPAMECVEGPWSPQGSGPPLEHGLSPAGVLHTEEEEAVEEILAPSPPASSALTSTPRPTSPAVTSSSPPLHRTRFSFPVPYYVRFCSLEQLASPLGGCDSEVLENTGEARRELIVVM
jgi:hypothetical protein